MESYVSILYYRNWMTLCLNPNDDRDCQIMSFKPYWASCVWISCVFLLLVYVRMAPHGFSGSESITIISYFDAHECSRRWLGLPGWASAFWGYIMSFWALFWRGHQNCLWHMVVQLVGVFQPLGLDSTISVKNAGSLVGVILEHKIWKLVCSLPPRCQARLLPFQWTDWGKTAMSYHSCLSPFYICSSFLNGEQ